MTQETLQELFVEEIRDIYDAEKQLTKALPKLAKAAASEELATALKEHLEETKGQITRLEQVFELIGERAKGKPCKGMKGLLEEGDEAVQDSEKGELRDLAIIGGCQRVEHYEISAYGTAKAMAEKLGLEDVVALLEQNEEEESAADAKLTGIAGSLYEIVDDEGAEEEDDAEMSSDEDKPEEEVESESAKPTRATASKTGASRATAKKAGSR